MSKENIEAIYELSPMQEGMFFHSLYAPQSGVYFQQLNCVLEGQLNTDAFQRAWQRVIERHAILRTAFVWKRLEKPLQVVSKHITLEIDTHDWRGLPQQTQAQRLKDFLDADKQQGFDLSKAPLMRLFLIRLTDERYQFVWSHSNMLLDGWSLFLVIKEVFEFYDAFRKGQTHELPPATPFKEYIDWLKQQDQRHAEDFWSRTLSGFSEPNTVEIKTADQTHTESYRELQLELPESLTSDLQTFARKHKLTLNTIIQGAWALLLNLYTGDDDIVFGTTVSGRPPALPNVESMVGLFINTLPLRIAISPQDSVLPWLQRIQSNNVELRDYEYSQLVDVQRKSDVRAGAPLFNSIIVFESFPVDSVVDELDTGLKIRGFTFVEQTNYPLTFVVIPQRRMVLKLAFAPREFHPEAIERMLSQLQSILESMIARPERKLISFVAAVDEQLPKLIGPTVAYPLDRCIHELFEQQVEQTPENIALVFEDQSLTYAQLNARANQLAHYLRRLGAQPDTKIGICLDRSLEMIVAVLGILKAGAAYVPLDPAYPQDRLAYMSADAGVAMLVSKASLASHAERVINLDLDRDLIARESDMNPVPVSTPDNLAYVIYTSGSTGSPKGVMVAHRSLVNYVLSMIPVIGLGSGERFLQFASLSFDASAVQIYPTLLSGATLVLHRAPAELSNVELKEFCERENVTVLDIPAGFWQQWVEDLASHDNQLKRSIRFYMTGGESVSVGRVCKWAQMLEHPAEFLSSYGPTETTIGAMISITPSNEADELKRPHLSLGFTLPNVAIHVLDRYLRPVPLGVTGEIYIGGAGLARGYLARAAQTAEKFVPDGFGQRLYRTGDLGRIVAGELEYVGRVDEQVKVRGYRVELGEIEAELNRQPEVKAAAVVLQGEEQRLVAYVELREAVTAAELRRRLQERLPEWMVPGVYERVAVLPVSANGKVDRKRLQASASERLVAAGEYEEARSGVEAVLAGIWSEVLKVERVGIHDNFFELGGHSLLATQLMSRVRDVLKLEVPMKALFDAPTVAGLSAVIEPQLRDNDNLEAPPLVPFEPNGSGSALSFAQQRLWILDQLEPGTPAFNLPAAARLTGPLDASVLERTLNEIVARHEALRTTFGAIDGRPVQLISPSLELTLPVVDLSTLETSQRETYIQRLANEELSQPFDLSRGPLVLALLVRFEPEQHVFLMTMHHIVSDGWSMIVFLRELAQIYSAFSLGKSSPLSPLSIQYADFAHWQREWLKDEVLDAQLDYWKERLVGDLPVLNLPLDHPRPAIQTFRGGTHTLLLPPALHDELNALGRREGTTLFMTLLAAFKTLLYRYCGESDVIIGTPIANRNRSEVEPLIGFFLNTLVLRTDLSGNPAFRELLARVRDVALGAYAHQDIPFELLLEQLQPERDLSRTPLFQVMFNMLNFSSSTINLPGLTVEGFSPFEASAKFDLNLYASKQENGLQLDFIYNRDLFEPETIEQLANHFRNLLQVVAKNPKCRLTEISLLTESNRKEMALRAAQGRPTNAYREFRREEIEQTITARFEQQVEQYPNNVAVQAKECSLTYRELSTWSNNVAAALPENTTQNVALIFEPGATVIVAILAALKAGKTYVPADPQNPIDRLRLILDDSQASAILTNTKNLSLARELSGRLPIVNVDEVDRSAAVSHVSDAASPNSHAYILYTSGSTGQPKGIVQNHRNVLFHIRNYTNNLHIAATDKLTLLSSYGFDAAVMDIFGALLNGATLCPFDIRDDGLAGFQQWLIDSKISIYHSTPTVYRYFLDSLTGREQFPGIRLVVLGGEEVHKRDLDLFRQHFSPQCIFVNGLGPTESTVSLQYFITHDAQVERSTVPVGYPVEGTDVLLLDTTAERTEVYGIGEIAIRSPHVALAYWRRPELTRSAFMQDRDDKRIYHTGDLGRLFPDGSIGFIGRKDQQVKIRGYRIEPGEVESALAEHPLIKEVTVIARANGNAEKQLAAYLVAREPAQVSVDEVRAFLKNKLPSYMVPSQFTMLQSLPLTTTGKVDRNALSRIEPDHVGSTESSRAPRTPVEEVTASIWSDILRRDGLGIEDNFFDLGGHSLLATQVLSRVRDAFDVELPLRSIFENPTIAGLSREVEVARAKQNGLAVPPLIKAARKGELPLSFSQQRLWFLDQLEPGNPAYNIHAAVRLMGEVDTDLLKRSLEAVIERHEILRTTFPANDGRPFQLVGPSTELQLPITDLEPHAAEEREEQALSLIVAESQQPFDLAAGPLLRTRLLRMSERDHILIVTMHHIISDAWSMGILVRDVAAFYKSLAEDASVFLPELQLQYADYASWQREWLKPEVLAVSLDYWKRQLVDKPLSMQLPTDKPRPATQTYNGALYPVAIEEIMADEVESLSRRESVSVFMTLLTAFEVMLSRYTGSEDIVVGTDVANRSRSEIEGLIGMFVNQLVLRSDLGGDPTFRELLGRVRDVALEAYAHQDMPFDKLVEAVKPDRELDRNPLFQVMFGFQNVPSSAIELPGLSIGRMGVDNRTSVFDLSLYMTRQGGRLIGSMRYNTDLFEPQTIGRLLDAFKVVLQTVVKNSDIRLHALLELIENDERQRTLAKEQELERARNQTFTKVRRRTKAVVA